MRYLKKFNETISNDEVDYFQSMVADLVDEGYEIEVKSYVNPGAWKEEGISIDIQREYSNPIVISDIVEKIKQIQSILPEYVVFNISVHNKSFNTTLDYKSLDDIKVKNMLKRGGLYSVLEYGMNEWISEMELDTITKPFEFFSGPGYKYHFIKRDELPSGSDHLKIEITERDIEEDVRPYISYMKIWLDRK
jgi:hypothetical protein